MDSPATLTIHRARELLQAGEITPDELTSACLAVIEAKTPR